MRRRDAASFGFRVLFSVLLIHSHVAMAIALAQQTINYASASGRVTDPSGAVVSGAQVIARETETNLSSMTSTDQEGRFRFPYLKPGQYEISVSAPGFAEIKRAVTLTVGAAFDLPLSLNVAAVETMSMSRVNKPYWKRRERRSLATSFKRKSRI